MSIRLRHLWRTAVSMWLAVTVSGFAGAKPPDLPSASREVAAPQAGSQKIEIIGEEQEEQEEQPIQAEQLTVMPKRVERIPVMPTEVPSSNDDEEFKKIIVQVNETMTTPLGFNNGPPTQAGPKASGPSDIMIELQNFAAARRMYLIGERCRHKGDLDMAVNCYQETHLICPACSYGLKAIARMHEIEVRRAADAVPNEAEEPETPKPEAAPSDFDTSLRPLPPLPDESVFRELEALLNEIADAKTAKLLIETEEAPAPAGATEEQEVPAATAPPTLLVPLPPKNLTIYVDEPETYGATSSLLRQAGDVLQTMTGLDIDVEFASARSGAGLRAQGSILLGTVGYKVSYTDEDGHTILEVVPSKP